MIPPLPRARAVNMLLIRTAMLAGVLLLGAVIWYMQRGGNVIPLAADRARMHGYVFTAMAIAALGTLFVLRARLERGVPATSLPAQYLIGYAVAEAAALFGAVTWYMGGSSNWYVAGVILMVAAFQILPIKRGDT